MSDSAQFLESFGKMLQAIPPGAIDSLAQSLATLRQTGGRLFVLGNGGSAANASHAVADFRKFCGIEAYCPSDNVAELTAGVNDLSWPYVTRSWLTASRLTAVDGLLVLSVNGGTPVQSENLTHAMHYAQQCHAWIGGIVGEPGGLLWTMGNLVIRIPTLDADLKTPFVESAQAVIWHCLVNHPALRTV